MKKKKKKKKKKKRIILKIWNLKGTLWWNKGISAISATEE
jgi:hypothetical protein